MTICWQIINKEIELMKNELKKRGPDYTERYEEWLKNQNEEIELMKNMGNLLKYLNNFLKIDIDDIDKLSLPLRYTLKLFLYEDFLYSKKIVDYLKGTPYEAVNKSVKKNLMALNNLKLIQTITLTKHHPDYRKRKGYYKLTTVGLFYVLKEIEYLDVCFYFSGIERNVKIFKDYRNDPMFEIFIYDLIDKNLLYDITYEEILWLNIHYLKQVCKEINKNFKSLKEFYKNNWIKMPQPLTWKFNLKDDKNKWMGFCNNLLGVIDFEGIPNLESDPITNCNISENHLSFERGSIRYTVQIDSENNVARVLMDGKEFHVIPIEKTTSSFVLYRIMRLDMFDMVCSPLIEIFDSIKSLRVQFGIAILTFFDEANCGSSLNIPDCRKFVKDEKINLFLREILGKLTKGYKTFNEGQGINLF